MMKATAIAHPNLALVKYWGKRDERLVLPHQSSLSLTLGGMSVRTTVFFDPSLAQDQLAVGGVPAAPADLKRALAVLDAVRAEAGLKARARVESAGDFPASAGLASSAAAYAALAAAAAWAAGLSLPAERLSALARLGSGSAARSIFGGFAVWDRGSRADGEDSRGRSLPIPPGWDLRVIVALVNAGRKAVSSREAMQRTVQTSPYYPAWVVSAEEDVRAAEAAIRAGDLASLGELAESNCLRMHASAMAARPPIVFFQPATLAAFAAVRALRDAGVGAWATVDAGPNVAVLCAAPDAARVQAALANVPGVHAVTVHPPGGGVARGEEHLG